MERDNDTSAQLQRLLDQLAALPEGAQAQRDNLILRMIQLRCMMARSEGEIMPPTTPDMRCVVRESYLGERCPDCPAARPAAPDTLPVDAAAKS